MVSPPLANSKYSQRVPLKDILVRKDGGSCLSGQRVVVGGWVKSVKETQKQPDPPPANTSGGFKENLISEDIMQSRCQILLLLKVSCGIKKINKPEKTTHAPKSIWIVKITDGSCVASLKIVVDSSLATRSHLLPGTCILTEGTLQKLPYSIPRKHFIELIADKILHKGIVDPEEYPLSTNQISLVKLRDWPHFRPRTTTVGSVTRIRSAINISVHSFFKNNNFFYVQLPTITTTSAERSGEKFLVTTDQEKEPGSTLEARENYNSKPQQTYLTASGRMHLESYACALGKVYSCGPRFRADSIYSSRQCAEMWMVETEIAFSQMKDVIKCARHLLKFLCEGVLADCSEDMDFVTNRIDKTSQTRLESIISDSYEEISYTKTVDILKNIEHSSPNTKFKWGDRLTTEHLSYLADEKYQQPLIIYDYPKDNKPFYVRQNDDGKTVAAFDLIVPKAGVVVSGSQNEERLDKLSDRIKQLNLPEEEYTWYVQLRKHGTVEHSGFSLALDSFLVFVTGLPDVQEAIPFPRVMVRADSQASSLDESSGDEFIKPERPELNGDLHL